MTFGITPNGFSIKRLPNIVDDINAQLKDKFGQIDTSPESVTGQFVGIVSQLYTDLWEQMGVIYSSQHPSEAAKIQLDYIGEFNGLTRLPAISSKVEVGCNGSIGTIVSIGTQAKSAMTGDFFQVITIGTITNKEVIKTYIRVDLVVDLTDYLITIGTEDYIFNSGVSATNAIIAQGLKAIIDADVSSVVEVSYMGDGDLMLESKTANVFDFLIGDNLLFFTPILFESIEQGQILVNEDTINIIETPLGGLDEINNFQEGSKGRALESDAEYRIRRLQSFQKAGAGNLEAIVSRMKNDIDGVVQVKGFENRNDVVDGDGRPPHSIEIIVDGGSISDIANLLWLIKGGGIRTHSSSGTYYDIVDSNGDLQRMFFSRPIPMYAWLKVTVSLYDEELFPIDGINQIKNNLLAYGNKSDIGLDIIPQRFFSSIYIVPGILVPTVQVAITVNPGGIPVYQTTPIPINDNWIAIFNLSRIQVTVI
jgi:uncharacterized phage protein gp47/JayE